MYLADLDSSCFYAEVKTRWMLALLPVISSLSIKIFSQFRRAAFAALHFEQKTSQMVEQTDKEEAREEVEPVVPSQVSSRRRQGLRVCHSGQVLRVQERQGEKARAGGDRDQGRERLLRREGAWAVLKVLRNGLQVGHVIGIKKDFRTSPMLA